MTENTTPDYPAERGGDVAGEPPPDQQHRWPDEGRSAGAAGEAAAAGAGPAHSPGQLLDPPAPAAASQDAWPEAAASAAGADIEIKVRTLAAERANITGQQVNDYSTRIYTGEWRERPRLTVSYFQALEAQALERATRGLVAEAAAVEEMLTGLEGRRLLIATGEPRLGKTSFALLLADRLLSRHGLAGAMICRHRLEADLQVGLQELICKDQAFAGRVVIFEDPLAGGNSDLLRFLRSLDGLALETLVRDLQASRSFLILTSDGQHLDERSSSKLARLGVLSQLAPLPLERLAQLLCRRAERLPWVGGDGEIARLRAFLAAHATAIAASLRTPPRVEDFLAERLEKVVRGELDLEQALARVDDLTPWLLEELPDDFAAWCFVLTLTLCGAAPRSGNVPWLLFERLRARLAHWLKRELASDDKERQVGEICRDETLLAKAMAKIQPAGSMRSGAIHFADPARAARLWEVLLGSGRTLLGLLLPMLHELIESSEAGLQAIAAQALGRIGELDRENVTLAFLGRQFARAARDLRQGAVVGSVIQGALGSCDASYRELAAGVIEHAALGGETAATLAAILSLQQVAEADLALSLRVLRGVAERSLVESLRDLTPLERRLNGSERYFRKQEAAGWQGRERLQLQELAMYTVPSLFGEAFADEFKVFVAVKLTLADLCSPDRLSRVLADLLGWRMADEINPLGALAALLFLELDGLADRLTDDPDSRPGEAGGSHRAATKGSALVQWLSPPVAEEVDTLALLLGSVYRQVAFYPGLLRYALRRRWLSLLTGWAELAASSDPVRPLVVDLFSRLLPTQALHVDEMGREMGSLLQRLQAKPGPHARLARDVLAHTPTRPGAPAAAPA
jgi:hypothetical protein